jgi:hypothetical protein
MFLLQVVATGTQAHTGRDAHAKRANASAHALNTTHTKHARAAAAPKNKKSE